MSLKIISCIRFRYCSPQQESFPGFYRSAFPGQKPIITISTVRTLLFFILATANEIVFKSSVHFRKFKVAFTTIPRLRAVTNQEPRKTIGYCFENNRLYCFPKPRWRLEKSDQSGGELRIQDGGSGSLSSLETRFHRMRKWPTGLEGPVSEKQLYLLKTPNSLQEGPVSTPLVGGRP